MASVFLFFCFFPGPEISPAPCPPAPCSAQLLSHPPPPKKIIRHTLNIKQVQEQKEILQAILGFKYYKTAPLAASSSVFCLNF